MIAGQSFHEAREWSSNFLLGSLVIALYVVFVLSVFAGFASYIIRTDWEARLVNGDTAQEVSELDSLFFMMSREENLKAEVGNFLLEVNEIDKLIDEAKQRLTKINAELDVMTGVVDQSARETLLFLRRIENQIEPESAQVLRALLEDDKSPHLVRAERVVMTFPATQFVAAVTPDVHEAINEEFLALSGKLSAAKSDMTRLGLERAEAESDRDRHLETRSWPRRKMQDAETELRQLQERMPLDSPHRAQVAALNDIGAGYPSAFVRYPTIFLTLFATIASGGLGAVVSFSRSFFSITGEPSCARLFVSVGEGIAAAIAVFLFFGAGMLVLTQGGGPGSQVELSPYTVAFVAFVSGFMAEDAFASIQAAGKRLFSGNGTPPEPPNGPEPAA